MSGTAKLAPLPIRQRRLFLAQFEKDLDFFRLFFLLVNKSRIIRHVGVAWAQDGPAAEIGLQRLVDTEDATRSPCSRYLHIDPQLDPDFCRIVNDYGRHEAESCALSDRAAELRCRETGVTQIYTCHAGLVDIAVPVISGGQYIGTVLCGQLLRQPPSESGFKEIRKGLSGLAYLDFEKLESAYWKVPVSSNEDIRNAVQLLEAFAGYVATSWGRLAELVQEQHRTIREAQVLRKELAHVILEGTGADHISLRELLQKLDLAKTPNRVLVVKIEPEEQQYPLQTSSFDVAFETGLQTVEEVTDTLEDVVVSHLRKQGICVFFHDSFPAYGLARRILDAVKAACPLRARIGIGLAREDVHSLAGSHAEACMALAQFPDEIAVYRKPMGRFDDLSAAAERVCTCLSSRKLTEARVAVHALPVLASRRLGEGLEKAPAQRHLLSSALYSMALCARQLGVAREVTEDILWRVDGQMHQAETIFALRQTYLQLADDILDEVRKLYSSRRDKIVERASRIIDESISQSTTRLSPSLVAERLGFSLSHLERTFKLVTGVTFERFVMMRRIDLAKRLLLDPAFNVSQVAERSGFADPAYFARVFRKIAGCSPREYIQNPVRFGKDAEEDGPPAAPRTEGEHR